MKSSRSICGLLSPGRELCRNHRGSRNPEEAVFAGLRDDGIDRHFQMSLDDIFQKRVLSVVCDGYDVPFRTFVTGFIQYLFNCSIFDHSFVVPALTVCCQAM